jgi:hypothetical protein
MRKIILFYLTLLSCLSYGQDRETLLKAIDSTNFDAIYPFALRGEMDDVFSLLQVSKDENLNKEQQKIKQKYYNRFITNSEDFEYNTSNLVMIDMLKRFQNYWRSILIEKVDQDLADKLFFNEMMFFLKREHNLTQSIEDIKPRYYALFQEFFKANGFHGLAMGKTDHLFDLSLWKNEEEEVYDIKLPETKVRVPVVFMKGFVSIGWSHYTTFGKNSTGGWTSSRKLNCVAEFYDTSTEKFRISYVAHEGQHFADIKVYPKLKQADLEYRAKLTELALGKESIIKIIKKFITNAKNVKSNAHAYSNYLIINKLSNVFFNSNYESDIDKWEGIPVKKINNFGIKYLKEHTVKLNEKGADNVESCIL